MSPSKNQPQNQAVGENASPAEDYPTSVVHRHLQSIQLKRWSDFFDTLFIEKFLVNTYPTTDYFERYQSAYPHEKKIILNGFKNFLIRSIDYDIVEYKVGKTVIDGDRAEVGVLMSTVEPYENLIFTRDPESGLYTNTWVKEEDKNLKRKLKVLFTLEQNRRSIPPQNFRTFPQIPRSKLVWKITGQTIKIQTDENLENYFVPQENDFFKEIIFFSLNSYEINPRYFEFLNNVANFLRSKQNVHVNIEGHTDDIGSFEDNEQLSQRRAQSVANYLLDRGVAPSQISTISKGESDPFTSDQSEEGRRKNRRAMIIFQDIIN